MFNFFKKTTNKNVRPQQPSIRNYAKYESDEKYKKMINDLSLNDLDMIVSYEKEPYVLSEDELQYMLTICNDTEKKGILYFAIATCYHDGTRGAKESHTLGMDYDKKAMLAGNPKASWRYGIHMTMDAGEALKSGTIDETEAKFNYTYGIGCVVDSYRMGFEPAKETLETFMEGRDEFYGAQNVDELIAKWPKKSN